MMIKYTSSHFSLRKLFSLLLLFMLVTTVNGQIVGGNEGDESDEKRDEKKEDRKAKPPREKIDRDSLTGTTFYLTGLFNYGHRSFEDKTISGLNSDLQFIKPDHSGGATIGVNLPLTNILSLDLGFTFFGHKEQYRYVNYVGDSTFSYSNTYMVIGMPVRLRYTVGEKLQFFGYLGLTPLNVVNIRYNESFTRANGNEVEREVEVIKDDKLAIFNLMATAGFGITYNFDWLGLTIYPEWRQQLFNTYNSQKGMDHKMYGLGVNMGLTLRL